MQPKQEKAKKEDVQIDKTKNYNIKNSAGSGRKTN